MTDERGNPVDASGVPVAADAQGNPVRVNGMGVPLDASGDPIMGARVQNGTAVNAQGQPLVFDSAGDPIANATIGPDGTIRGPDGQPVPVTYTGDVLNYNEDGVSRGLCHADIFPRPHVYTLKKHALFAESPSATRLHCCCSQSQCQHVARCAEQRLHGQRIYACISQTQRVLMQTRF